MGVSGKNLLDGGRSQFKGIRWVWYVGGECVQQWWRELDLSEVREAQLPPPCGEAATGLNLW